MSFAYREKVLVGGVMLSLALGSTTMHAQEADEFSRKNTWTVFSEYANTSSHILLGQVRQRKLADFGGSYAWRIGHTGLRYVVEYRPVLFEGDVTLTAQSTYVENPQPAGVSPYTVTSTQVVEGACRPLTYINTFPIVNGTTTVGTETVTSVITCGRHWTYGEAITPVGLRYSFMTKRPMQPFVIATGGYMFSDHAVPLDSAGFFNFTFDFGAGIEVFRSKTQSFSVEARYHHFGNNNTASSNPGVDSLVYKLSYNFGR